MDFNLGTKLCLSGMNVFMNDIIDYYLLVLFSATEAYDIIVNYSMFTPQSEWSFHIMP